MRKTWAIALVGIAITTGFLYWLASFPSLLEPDRLFHLALLRELAVQHVSILRTWPQFPLLGWQNFFADKEFLFHFLLEVPYHLGGDRAALLTGLLFSALAIWLPFLAFPRARWLALSVSLSLFLLHPHLLYRFALLRPHTLATLIFTAFLAAYYHRRYRIAAAALFLFPLAYHAIYVPFFFLVLALAVHRFRGEADPRKFAALLLALAVGTVVHPYFPANLTLGLQHLALSFRTAQLRETLHLQFGGELLPPPAFAFFLAWSGVFVALLVALSALRRHREESPVKSETVVLGACSLLFFSLGFRSLRILEFAAPVWIFFLASALAGKRRWQDAALFAIVVCQLSGLLPFLKNAIHSRDEFRSPAVAEMRSLLAPLQGQRVRIFHDNWGLGPYVTYLLPEAEAVDALDPTFLLLANPELAGLRTALAEGRVAKPVEAIRKAFGADYALCEPTALQLQLLHAEGVRVLSVTPDKRFALFALPRDR